MNIALFGAGKFGKMIKNHIEKTTEYTVKYFIDNNPKLYEKQIENLPIISFDQLLECMYDKENGIEYVIISAIKFSENICRQFDSCSVNFKGNNIELLNHKINTYARPDVNEILQIPNIPINDKPMILTLGVNLTDVCNLNCKSCAHFCNLFDRNESQSFDDYKKDIKYLSENCIVGSFSIYGGEPLLSADVTRYIDVTRKYFPDSIIEVITNGLLVPKMDENFFNCINTNNVTIRVSGYKPTLKMIDIIIEKLELHKVNYIVASNIDKFYRVLSLKGDSNPEKAARVCEMWQCTFYRNSKIYKCPVDALFYKYAEHFNIPSKEDSGVDIYQISDWNKTLNDLRFGTVEFCKYCAEKIDYIDWDVSKEPQKEDWIADV